MCVCVVGRDGLKVANVCTCNEELHVVVNKVFLEGRAQCSTQPCCGCVVNVVAWLWLGCVHESWWYIDNSKIRHVHCAYKLY